MLLYTNITLNQIRGKIVFSTFLIMLIPMAAQARDLTFTWDANVEQIDGYKLYYKSGSTGGAPYDGSGAAEGGSPVYVGNVTGFTLHNLSDSETYYFTLTAYKGSDESPYATEIKVEAIVVEPVVTEPVVTEPIVTEPTSTLPATPVPTKIERR